MARASTTFLNQALDGAATPTNLYAYSQLHSGDTSTTGANELGSTTRQSSTYGAASGAAKTNSASITWTTPGTTAATYFGTFSASTAGTFGIGGALGASVTATSITAAAGALSVAAA